MKNAVQKLLLAFVLGWGNLWGSGDGAIAQNVSFFPNTTYKIVQLTGGTDTARRIPTLSRTTDYCVSGTDLGSSFEHNGQLHFLFGDTPSLLGGDGADDFLAWTSASRPEDVFLNIYKNGNCFLPIAVPGVPLAGCEVPSYGISVGGLIYIVVTTDTPPNSCNMSRSVMAVSHDNGVSFQQLYDLSALSSGHGKFINVSMIEVDGAQFPGVLPAERCVMIWGSGLYHFSDVALAFVPSAQIGNKAAIKYYCGGCDTPSSLWSTNEAFAASMFNPSQSTVGEFSVQYCQQLGQWIMLYNARDFNVPEGIQMRSALNPWGPWSQPVLILNGNTTNRDHAFSQYIHRPPATNGDKYDIIEDQPYQPGTFGGLYGPYMIPRFFRGDQNRVTIVYTVSTWNPYQALLMQSDIGYPDRVAENITSSVTLPGDTTDGWANSSTFLRGFVWTNGMRYVTSSFTGDADMGVSHYGISVGCTDQALEFQVHGGDAEVVLIEQTQTVPTAIPDVPGFYLKLKRGDYGPVVETVIGPQSITPGHEISVRSDLRRHHGKMMRLFVIDALTQVWGFISVSEIRHFFTSANSPAYIYVDRAHTDLPFLGTPGCPFPTLIAGYNAATDSACAANVLKIRVGHYPEALTLNKPITLNAEGGAATIGPP